MRKEAAPATLIAKESFGFRFARDVEAIRRALQPLRLAPPIKAVNEPSASASTVRPPLAQAARQAHKRAGARGWDEKIGEQSMRALAMAVRVISGINWLVGNVFAWLSLGIVVVCFTVVVQRYAFSTGNLWMQDLYIWLNGAMFTAVAGYALMRDEHVRVDIFYRPASVRTKAIIDLIGVFIFLLPFCFVVALYGWTFVSRSWRLYEASRNIGGMPGLFILKSFIIAFAVLVALQGLAMAARSVLVLAGRESLLPPGLRYQVEKESTLV
jgi:TRAP-type mannitol/chloroaromatic compound transport system permease small subunit